MRSLFIFLALMSRCFGQHTLYATGSNPKGFVVGAKLPPSGVFQRLASGEWRHVGFNHPFASAVAAYSKDQDLVYLAAGNGLIRLSKHGEKWRILTGTEVTELRDLAVDQRDGTIYFTHTRGIAASHDSGRTWQDISGDLKRRFAESIRVDGSRPATLVAATEAGIFRTENGGAHWQLAGAAGWQILRVEQSPADGCQWLATSEQGGLFASSDCARTFEGVPGRLGVDRDLYDLAWDPRSAHRVAVAGFHFGIAISEDNGATWAFRNKGLPSENVWSVVFDPDHDNRLFASVNEEAVYVSEDGGKSWKADGLPGSAVSRFAYVPDGAAGK